MDLYKIAIITVVVVVVVVSDLLPNHQQSMSILRDSQVFTKYVVTVALQKVKQVHWGCVCVCVCVCVCTRV